MFEVCRIIEGFPLRGRNTVGTNNTFYVHTDQHTLAGPQIHSVLLFLHNELGTLSRKHLMEFDYGFSQYQFFLFFFFCLFQRLFMPGL